MWKLTKNQSRHNVTVSNKNADLQICKRVLDGEKNLFSVLVKKYQNRVFRLGMSFVKNTDDADDFTQDVMLKAYTSLAAFRGDAAFSTWLMRIAYNAGINSVKRKHEYTSIAESFDVEDIQATPEEQHLIACLQTSIRHAVALLPERYRICVDLYFFYDMPYADIEKITGLPVNTIKSHIFRAKKILKDTLYDDADYPRKNHTDWCLYPIKFAYDL